MPSNVTPIAVSPRATGGMFSQPGLEPGIVSAYRHGAGLYDFLVANNHVMLSMVENPVFMIVTGQSASTGTEPTTGCAPTTVAGALKHCSQILTYGEYSKTSRVIQVDRAGALNNGSVQLDARFINNPFNTEPSPVPVSPNDVLKSAKAQAILAAKLALHREYKPVFMWSGNPSNTSGSTGGYQENRGLSLIVNNGYVDVVTGAACPAANSNVVAFGNLPIVGNEALFVNTISSVVREARDRAAQTGLQHVGALVMPRAMWPDAVQAWTCTYATGGCGGAANTPVFRDGLELANLRESIYQSQMLRVDGLDVLVILDDDLIAPAVTPATVPPSQRASIFYIPLYSLDGVGSDRLLTYIDHFNYRGPDGMASLIGGKGFDEYDVSPDGRYAIGYRTESGFCKDVVMRMRLRLIVRAPFLAARIDGVQFNTRTFFAPPQPSAVGYINGGVVS